MDYASPIRFQMLWVKYTDLILTSLYLYFKTHCMTRYCAAMFPCCPLPDGFITLHIQWKIETLSFFRHTLGCFVWWWTPIKCCQSTLRRSLICTKAKSATRSHPISTPSRTTPIGTWCKVRPALLDVRILNHSLLLFRSKCLDFTIAVVLETSNASESERHFYFTNWQQNSIESLYNNECHLCLLKWSVTAGGNRSLVVWGVHAHMCQQVTHLMLF